MSEENRVVVIDNGSGRIKAGYTGDDEPIFKLPSKVRRGLKGGGKTQDFVVGEQAFKDKEIVHFSHPIERGVITNWDDMEKIWHHVFYNELKVAPEEHAVIVSEPPLNPKANRERMTKIMFETFNVKNFYVAIQAVLSLYASGRTTGVVLDSGYDVTHSVPIYEGYALPHAILSSTVAGRDVTDFLKKILIEKGYSDLTEKEVNEIKEKCCYVSFYFENEIEEDSEGKSTVFEINGTHVDLGKERFRTAEILFESSLIGKEELGAPELVFNSVMKCDVDIRWDFYTNIVLAGGSTMFDGFQERLVKEMIAVIPAAIPPKVIAPPKRTESAWLGMSILASLSSFDTMWISSKEYEESGPSIVHRKCF